MMSYHLLSFFLKLLSYIPFGVLYFLSDCLFYVVYYAVRYRRGVVRKNLVGCFPEKSEQEIKQIEKKFYRFFTDLIFESCKMASISPTELRRRMKFTNVEAAKAVLREGKTISLYMGHYGNWEWVSSMPLWMEADVISVQIYHKLSNENMNKLILNNRERMGAVSVEMRKTARYITEQVAAHNVSVIGFIADQAPRKVPGSSNIVNCSSGHCDKWASTRLDQGHSRSFSWFRVLEVRGRLYDRANIGSKVGFDPVDLRKSNFP